MEKPTKRKRNFRNQKGKNRGGSVMKTNVTSVSYLSGTAVKNKEGENLGKIEDFMVDLTTGRILYAVLSFGGFIGIGNKLFAIPINALKLDLDKEFFLLDVDKERLEKAPGFDKDNWPDMAGPEWGSTVHSYYGVRPYTHNPFNL
jgi:sporulation protein YlmC with PRC-barrel domain